MYTIMAHHCRVPKWFINLEKPANDLSTGGGGPVSESMHSEVEEQRCVACKLGQGQEVIDEKRDSNCTLKLDFLWPRGPTERHSPPIMQCDAYRSITLSKMRLSWKEHQSLEVRVGCFYRGRRRSIWGQQKRWPGNGGILFVGWALGGQSAVRKSA